MPESSAASVPESEPLYAAYEGFWTRLLCAKCGEMFEVEGDVSSGETVECDACGTEQGVSGR